MITTWTVEQQEERVMELIARATLSIRVERITEEDVQRAAVLASLCAALASLRAAKAVTT